MKRARYNASMMDANTLVKGEEYDRLPECYCIFITEKDVMGCGLPVYHAQRVISETGKLLGDGTHIIYVKGLTAGMTRLAGSCMIFHAAARRICITSRWPGRLGIIKTMKKEWKL